MIPFLNFKDINIAYRQELIDAIAGVIDSGQYILGKLEKKRFKVKVYNAFAKI